MHLFIQQIQKWDSAQVQIFHRGIQRFVVVKISGSDPSGDKAQCTFAGRPNYKSSSLCLFVCMTWCRSGGLGVIF